MLKPSLLAISRLLFPLPKSAVGLKLILLEVLLYTTVPVLEVASLSPTHWSCQSDKVLPSVAVVTPTLAFNQVVSAAL